MSSNRLMYDTCNYEKYVSELNNQNAYLLNESKFYNCNKCRMEQGIIGGTAVSHIKGNLVDLESDLKGITRQASLCNNKQFSSNCNQNMNQCKPDNIKFTNSSGCEREIDTSMVHLEPCNMINYKEIPHIAPHYHKQC